MHRLAERSGQRRQLVFEVVTVQVDHVVVYDAVERHDLLRQSVELLCVLHENIHQFSSVQFSSVLDLTVDIAKYYYAPAP